MKSNKFKEILKLTVVTTSLLFAVPCLTAKKFHVNEANYFYYGPSQPEASDVKEYFFLSGLPNDKNFRPDQIKETIHEARWYRKGGGGGEDKGKDIKAPDGRVVVSAKVFIKSAWNVGRMNMPIKYIIHGSYIIPIAAHIGTRLNPKGLLGAGACFNHKVIVKHVSLEDWMSKLKIPSKL